MTTCLLIYYTGTFNTRYVTRKLSARLEALGWEVTVYEIDPSKLEKLDLGKYDIIGLGYPIYGYCAPWPFLKFIRHQKFPKGKKVFIYKNSGETETANDASSKYVTRKLDWDGARTRNEYHFLMPYNIHFKYEDNLVREMLTMDEKLYDILVYEILHDGDLNIYVVTKNKDGSKIKGKSIGKSLFITSFYISDKKKWAKNSIIDINDSSGNEYLQEIIQNPPPLFNDFIPNAGNGKYYDFKERNKDNRIDNHCWHYRGMPINIFTDGQIRYVSARDVGNIAAGYMAAINGMPWLATRMAFDAYQSYTDNRLSIEGISSKTPQLFGWLFGKQSLSFQERINMLISSIRAVINNPNVLYSHED